MSLWVWLKIDQLAVHLRIVNRGICATQNTIAYWKMEKGIRTKTKGIRVK